MRSTSWISLVLAAAACGDGGAPATDATPIDTAVIDTPVDAAIDSVEVDAPLDGSPDAPSIDAPLPLGRHTYVVSRLRVPATSAEATMMGLDIDNRASDGVDNQFGMLMASIGALAPGFSPSAGVDVAIDRGGMLILADVRADDLVNDAGAAAFLHVGAMPVPPACSGPGDAVCRRHLAGTGSFALAAGVPPGQALTGNVLAGRLAGGPGDFTLPYTFGTGVVNVPIRSGRVELRLTATGLTAGSKLGGGVRRADFDTIVVPALHANLAATVTADCPPPGSPPGCNCAPGSSGAQMLNLVDNDDDCTISLAEVQDTFDSVLTNDLDLDGDGVTESVSVGFGIEAVAATFPAAP